MAEVWATAMELAFTNCAGRPSVSHSNENGMRSVVIPWFTVDSMSLPAVSFVTEGDSILFFF